MTGIGNDDDDEVGGKQVNAGFSTTINVALIYLPSLLTVPMLVVYVDVSQFVPYSVVKYTPHDSIGVKTDSTTTSVTINGDSFK